MAGKITKTALQWREILNDEQYRVTRQAGTEPAFSGEYVAHHDSGSYHCVCCNQTLFLSENKFDSGCGWPSFSAQSEQSVVTHHSDLSLGMERTEIRCQQCGAHLGHLFNDGPKPTGERYCINSVSLSFNAKK